MVGWTALVRSIWGYLRRAQRDSFRQDRNACPANMGVDQASSRWRRRLRALLGPLVTITAIDVSIGVIDSVATLVSMDCGRTLL